MTNFKNIIDFKNLEDNSHYIIIQEDDGLFTVQVNQVNNKTQSSIILGSGQVKAITKDYVAYNLKKLNSGLKLKTLKESNNITIYKMI